MYLTHVSFHETTRIEVWLDKYYLSWHRSAGRERARETCFFLFFFLVQFHYGAAWSRVKAHQHTLTAHYDVEKQQKKETTRRKGTHSKGPESLKERERRLQTYQRLQKAEEELKKEAIARRPGTVPKRQDGCSGPDTSYMRVLASLWSGQSYRTCCKVWISSPQGQSTSSVGTNRE